MVFARGGIKPMSQMRWRTKRETTTANREAPGEFKSLPA